MSCWSWTFVALLALALACELPGGVSAADTPLSFGFAKAEITPHEPLRLSGYGNRTEPYTGIDEPLWIRAMVARDAAGPARALVTVDTIGLPGQLVDQIARRLRRRHGIDRPDFVICFSHTHTAPHISGGLTNIFAKPLTDEQRAKSKDYTERLATTLVDCVGRAIADLAPGTLHAAEGRVTFAQNRRVLTDGKWTGFGVNPDGPVDHSLPLLKITGVDGQLRAIIFNYACHCTTFGSDHNRINGDWAGYAVQYLEEAFPGTCALCTIGCGADANPPRDRERAMQFAQAEGREIEREVKRLLETPMRPITSPLTTRFGYAQLPIERPTVDELKQQLDDQRAQVRNHAQNMLAIHQQQGSLPRTHAAPLQVWRFGDQLAMVFLSGEVVVDYALRLQRELEPLPVWVTAYANDLFAYVASQRMRSEGGYEVDHSMIYYNLPGRWAEGTEGIFVRRIHELLK